MNEKKCPKTRPVSAHTSKVAILNSQRPFSAKVSDKAKFRQKRRLASFNPLSIDSDSMSNTVNYVGVERIKQQLRLLKQIETSVNYSAGLAATRPSIQDASVNLIFPTKSGAEPPRKFKKMRLSYGKIKAPEDIQNRHIRELKIALDIKNLELQSCKAVSKFNRRWTTLSGIPKVT